MPFIKRRKEPELPPEVMIVGLGNPGPQYAGTRHNVGFDFIELFAKKHKIVLSVHKYQAQFGIGSVLGHSVLLVKPLTFMNLSGRAVVELAKHYRLQPSAILVVADDLDMEVARVRMRGKGSSGGHNGHKSIIQSLATDDYPRIKIGIGKGQETIGHVLNKFKPDERTSIKEALAQCIQGAEIWLELGIDAAMNTLNRKSDQNSLD